jgi:lysophospholipid acyltransferase (LPLAT)-like uncharacterized protein
LSDARVRQSDVARDDVEDRAPDRRVRWLVRLGVPLIRLLGRTWRIRVVNGDATVGALRRQGEPIIFALWHGDMLPLLYLHRDEGVFVLISEHRDGEIIARAAESLGFRTVRGSTTRGATRALVGLVRELEAGHDVAITPDGPRGPARSFAPGALIAAQRAGAAVIAVGLSAPKAWRLRTWDRFVIPKPFSRFTVAYSEPAKLVTTSARAAAQETTRFEELMADVERLADA